MSDLEQRCVERKVDIEDKVSEDRKQRNTRRFMWHEQLIKAGKLPIAAVRLAGLIMHKRMLTTHGYVALSAKDMADELGITERGGPSHGCRMDRASAIPWTEEGTLQDHIPRFHGALTTNRRSYSTTNRRS